MCLFCFSSQPLSRSERNGKYGSTIGAFADYRNRYNVTLCQAPCHEPCCWLGSMICFCPAVIYMRHEALNHVSPGSGWSNYKCCQGYFGGCCCFQPGSMCEENCPCPCMCLESFLFPGMAVTSNSFIIREEYALGLDEDDVRLIRCNNCLQISSWLLFCCSMFTECEADDQVAHTLGCIADVVFCCTGGCMTAQTHHEIKLREASRAPKMMRMNRLC